jgi:hypothetical protein
MQLFQKVKDGKVTLKVFIRTRPNLRCTAEETNMYIGYGMLEKLFDKGSSIPEIKNIQFWYPERWLNILEQRQLFNAIDQMCPNIETIEVVTHSVYIIQCTPNECAFLMDNAAEYPDISFSPGVRYCPLSKDSELTIFGGEIKSCSK